MRLLLINPNTTQGITDRLARAARRRLGPEDQLTAITATQGPAVVRSAAQLAQAEVSALQLADRHRAAHDALVLGISLDGAVVALRERWPGAVIVGMTEAALVSAALSAQRLGVLTLGAELRPLYAQRVDEVGLTARLAGIEAPELAAAFATAGDDDVQPHILDELAAAGRRLQAQGAGAVVLAGAVLCGYAAALQAALSLPVFDGVECATLQARALWQLRRTGP